MSVLNVYSAKNSYRTSFISKLSKLVAIFLLWFQNGIVNKKNSQKRPFFSFSMKCVVSRVMHFFKCTGWEKLSACFYLYVFICKKKISLVDFVKYCIDSRVDFEFVENGQLIQRKWVQADLFCDIFQMLSCKTSNVLVMFFFISALVWLRRTRAIP